jgi:hypothetical protein
MIEAYHFGSMQITGKTYQADLKIIRGQVVANWWRNQGHVVDVADVADVLAAKPEILVVGKGQPGNMQVAQPLRAALEAAGIELIAQSTGLAAATFNRLHIEGKNVAAAFHLTC